MESNAQSLPESIPRPVPTMAGQKDVLGVRLPAMEDELHHNASQVQGELSHSLKSFDSQQRIPLTTEALPARLPAQRAPQLPFPIALQPGQNPSPLLSAGRGQGLWTPAIAQNPALAQTTALAQSAALSTPTGSNLVQKALQLTAQIAKQNQLKNVMLPTVPSPRPTFTPILPLPVVEGDSDAAVKLKEPLASKTGVAAPQRVESVHSPQHADSAPSPQQDETVPSPQPLKERHRMGSDDLLADEIIEKMEKSYSDDENTKKQEEEEELTGLESQEEMENMSQEDLNSVLDDDDDHDSFASLLEHETAGFIREDDKASAPPSTPPSVKTTPTPGKMHASTAAKVQKRIFTIKDCEHISRPAPQNVIDRIKAGTKRAPLNLTEWNFPKKSKYSRGAPFIPRVPAPKAVNQSLHMMRLILQPSFNKELFNLVSGYLELFYQAAGNVCNNGCHDKLDEGKVQEMVTGMLGDACRALHGEPQESRLPKFHLLFDSDGQTPMAKQKLNRDKEMRAPLHRQTRRPAGDKVTTGRQQPDTSEWNPDGLTEESKFVLGVRANEAYGYGGYRGKIYYVHPNLFRYNTDNEDRRYLLEHRKLTLQGGRAFLVLYDQIVKIMDNNTYYSNNESVVQEVRALEEQAFTLPKFILKKVQELMREIIGQYGRRSKVSGIGKQQDPVRLGVDLEDMTSDTPPLLESSIEEGESQTEESLVGGDLEEAAEELEEMGSDVAPQCAKAQS